MGTALARKIVITSGKGGVGKTSLTANLGAALSRRGLMTVLMDADFGLNNLDVTLGVEGKIIFDIVDVLENRCRLKQALIKDQRNDYLYILPSAHTYDRSNITGQSIRYLINMLSESFDYVLVDCPAGIEAGFHRAVSAADEALVVTTPHISAIRDADKVIAILKSYEINQVGLIINRARGDLIAGKEMIKISQISDLLRTDILGVIPDDDEIASCASIGKTIGREHDSAIAFDLIAKNLHDGTCDILDITAKYQGLFGRMRRYMKKHS